MATHERYPLSIRLLHWLMALMIITMLAIGLYMANLPDDAPNKYDLYPLHKSFGMIVMALVLIRIPARLLASIPTPHEGLKNWEVSLSHIVHGLLYLAMLTMTLSGYFMNSTFLHAQGIDMFGLFTVPDITAKSEYWNGITHEIHEIGAFSFIGLLVLHIAGVVKHRFIDGPGHDVLKRML